MEQQPATGVLITRNFTTRIITIRHKPTLENQFELNKISKCSPIYEWILFYFLLPLTIAGPPVNRDWPRIPTADAEPPSPRAVPGQRQQHPARGMRRHGWGETRGGDGGGGGGAWPWRRGGEEEGEGEGRRVEERVAELDLCMRATEDWASDGPVWLERQSESPFAFRANVGPKSGPVTSPT